MRAPFLLSAALLGIALSCCPGCRGPAQPNDASPAPPSPSGLLAPAQNPAAFPDAVGVERVLRLPGQPGAGSFGVDAVRMPRLDPALGEQRDDYLFVASCGTGIQATLVDDGWQIRAERFWPMPGTSCPWSDLKAAHVVDAAGRDRLMIYFCSRGTDQLVSIDATDFPETTMATQTIEIGLPIAVRGAHTLQLCAPRGVLVLNGLDVGGVNLPPPLVFGSAPAVFLDVRADPLHPRRLSVFLGDPGDQIMFDSQFLRLDGKDVWAPTISRPLEDHARFVFFEMTDPGDMQHARKLGEYEYPRSGAAHNVVQLPPGPDGEQPLAAGFEGWAFDSGPTSILSKAAVIDVRQLFAGRAPTFTAFLLDDANRIHSVHNPATRLFEVRSHTYDTVPLAHYTGGYFVYEYGPHRARMLAHVPLGTVKPTGRPGMRHAALGVPVWMALYNGCWDAVTSWFGDFVSAADREAAFLIEPTYGFVRHFGTYIARADGTVPRIYLAGSVPEVGAEFRLGVSGLAPGGRLVLSVATRAATTPRVVDTLGALFHDPDAVVTTLTAEVTGDSVEFAIPALAGDPDRLVLTAIEHLAASPDGRPGGILKSPAATFRLRPAKPW